MIIEVTGEKAVPSYQDKVLKLAVERLLSSAGLFAAGVLTLAGLADAARTYGFQLEVVTDGVDPRA